MLRMTVKGIRNLQRDLGAETKRQKQALNIALKIEGFRLLRELREEIKKGDPGGHPYAAQLSKLASRTKTGRLRKNQMPLYRVARMLRYNAEYKNGSIEFSFGFLDHGKRPISSTYKAMLQKHQEGIDVLYRGSRTELGIRFARIGGRLKKKGDPDAKYFFLRKTTGRKIHLPRRQIVDPFWEEKKGGAIANIRKNFRLKLQGQRI